MVVALMEQARRRVQMQADAENDRMDDAALDVVNALEPLVWHPVLRVVYWKHCEFCDAFDAIARRIQLEFCNKPV